MPLFFNTRRKDTPVSPALRGPFTPYHVKANKSTATVNERPQTSGGILGTGKARREGGPKLLFTSKWTSTAGQRSTLTLATENDMADDEDQSIGIAIGSPSDSQAPVLFPPVLGSSTTASQSCEQSQPQSQSMSTAQRSEGSEDVEAEAQKVRRWKTVSGLFARKKAATSVVTAPEGAGEASNTANQTPQAVPRTDESRRKSISFKRSRKPQVPPPSVPVIDDKYRETSHPTLPTPTPGQARAYEAENPQAGPSLDIDIPDSGMDRYSVMFSKCLPQSNGEAAHPRQSLLARRKGAESLSIMSPSLTTTRSTSTLDEDDAVSPDTPQAKQAQTAALPIRTYSLAPFGPQYRLSAVPAPLFSQKHQQLKHSRSAIGILSSDTAPTCPEDPFAISEAHPHPPFPLTPRLAISAPDSPPGSPVGILNDEDYDYDYDYEYSYDHTCLSSRRGSTLSTSSSAAFPPSPTSSTASYSHSYAFNHFLAKAATATYTRTRTPELTILSPRRAAAAPQPTVTATLPAPGPQQDQPASTTNNNKTTFLALPSPAPSASTPIPCTPWDLSKAFPSPLYPSSSPSPRLKFGYDSPHSPLISIAKAVTVSVRACPGTQQRPTFVVREGEGAGGGGAGVWAAGAGAPRTAVFVHEE